MINNFRYTDEKCPVCGEVFTEQSEIVVCPLCGTPHHKECYKKNGECGNSEKHSEGFIWKPASEPEPDGQSLEQNPQANEPPHSNANPQDYPFGAPVPPQALYQAPNPLGAFPPELEDGVSTEDAAAFIKRNYQNYLRKFFLIKSGRRTFNIAAFFFGGYWFIYRKMYKLGVIFIALSLAITAIPLLVPQCYRLQKEIDDISYEYEVSAFEADSPMDAMNEMYSKMFAAIKKYPTGVAVTALSTVAQIALSFYLGFNADKKYREHILGRVKSIKSDCAQAGAQNEDFYKMQILSEGGSSFGFAILSIIAVNGINHFISAILNMIYL